MTKKSTDINYISKDLFPKAYQRTMIDDDYIKKLEQENQQLKDNWKKLKEYIDKNRLILNNPNILDFYIKMQELEEEQMSYMNLSKEELQRQLEWADPYEFSYGYALYLQKENKKLKKQLQIKDDGFKAVNEELCEYAEENAELKKQLEEKTKIGVANHKYTSKCEDKVITMENQQKEFVKYLENKINFTAMNIQGYTLDIYQLILEKYKEIIGENNE